MFVPGPKTHAGCSIAVLLLVLSLVAAPSAAQSVDSQVHVLPRSASYTPSGRLPTFQRDVDLVLVNVTVLDRFNRAVTGLSRKDFSLLEDRQPQTIKYLSSDDQPLSLAIVLDASASMAPRLQQARKAVLDLVRTSNPADDISLVIVGDLPKVAFGFNDPIDTLPSTVEALRAEGRTALWDAMVLSLDQLKHAHYPRRAMVVISDGGDNRSVYTESELKSILDEADVQVYAVGLFDRFPRRNEERRGPLELDELTSTTGGRLLSVHDADELCRAVQQINLELRNEYVIGYVPSEVSRDGRWHSIKVGVKAPSADGKVRLYARKGYFGSAE